MIKDIIQQNENATPNSKQLAVLKEHFPACFTADGSFDVERFKATIANDTNVVQEGYELKFMGKSYAKLLASTDTTTVIQPNEAHNSLPENTNSENIYISGDNLDGLKHLLKSYNEAIKCIYIDPPYNTGTDGFVYADKFNYSKENLQEKLSVSEEEADRILELTKRGSASHSAWLMFMYSRLLLARDLLTKDGVIFISIDDNEQANLKLLCDDVFGEESFIECISWNKRIPKNDKGIGNIHEHILVYVRNKNYKHEFTVGKQGLEEIEELVAKLKRNKTSVSEAEQEVKKLYKRKGYDRGITLYNSLNSEYRLWGKINMSWPNAETFGPRYEIKHPKTGEPVKVPDRGWRWISDTFDEAAGMENGEYKKIDELPDGSFVCGRIWFDKDNKTQPSSITFLDEVEKFLLRSVISLKSDGGIELENIFDGKSFFSYPKPTSLLRLLVGSVSLLQENDIVLDFFSGSATTADALMQLNALDDKNRKFISIQLPEILKSENPSQKAAYDFLKGNNLPTTLDYIGIERLKRAAAKIKQEHPDKEMDLGFKHYMLAEPNQNTLDKLESFDKAAMLADTTIMDDFGKPTILATWLNADGYGLTTKAEAIDLAGYTAYYYHKHLYFIDPGFTLDSMKALLSKYDAEGHFNPENLVLFGYSFPDWSINEMIEKNLRILNDGEKNLKINFNVRY
ncbi:MAG: site-specific DNA-methyltransferase [Ferruginibacter sp.]